MEGLRDFENIVAYLSDREIDELQDAIDACREVGTGRAGRRGPEKPALGE